MRRKRETRPKINLTEGQVHYLTTGDHGGDAEVYLDWARPWDQRKAKRTFLAIRDYYPAGTFPWAEEKFGRGK